MKYVYLLLPLIFLSACAVRLVTPTQVDAQRGQAKFSGLTLEELHEGKKIYELNCQTCHGLKKPTARTEAEWKEIVPKMVQKTNKKAGKMAITEGQEQVLLKYLITMGS